MLSLALLAGRAGATDPCQALLKTHGSLTPVLKPKQNIAELETKMQRGESVNVFVVHNSTGEVTIRSTSLLPDQPPQLVFVKQMTSSVYSAGNANLMRNYKQVEERGLMPGFEVFPLLSASEQQNVFPFFEGRELCSAPGDLEDLSHPEVRVLYESYRYRLEKTASTLQAAGFRVMIDHPRVGLPDLEAWRGAQPVLSIAPCNIWVTIDGRFMIFDPI